MRPLVYTLLLIFLPTASALLSLVLFPLKSWSSLRNQRSDDEAAASAKSFICGDAVPTADLQVVAQASRRKLIRNGFVCVIAAGMYGGSGAIPSASAYTGKTISSSGRLVDQVEPDERKTYAEAQNGPGGKHKRVLWVGPGTLTGVFKNIFRDGSDVTALDLLRPDGKDLSAATKYATEHGYRLNFEQGDATKMTFTDESFDVVVSSMFLCQDFDPEVVVSEIRRVLKPGGRFGWYEHVEDIDGVIVDRVFGERSVIRVQAYPEMVNVVAGVVKKI